MRVHFASMGISAPLVSGARRERRWLAVGGGGKPETDEGAEDGITMGEVPVTGT